jgi:alpha-amylase
LKDGPDASQWKTSYEGLGRVMCYNNVVYAGDRKSATVTATCRKHSSIAKMEYNWNNSGYNSQSTFKATTALKDTLTLSVRATDAGGKQYEITVAPSNFVWQNPAVNQPGNYKNGQKGAIVELFGWPYADIKEECQFLANAGYMGVKVFPPQESVWSNAWP